MMEMQPANFMVSCIETEMCTNWLQVLQIIVVHSLNAGQLVTVSSTDIIVTDSLTVLMHRMSSAVV